MYVVKATNIEFKARCTEISRIKCVLKDIDARFEGEDHQVDTYFVVPEGRLKLREGTIERNLIYYRRPNQAELKKSEVQLFPVEPGGMSSLKALLSTALGIKCVVDKRRQIYFVNNVKIHIDSVVGLGNFVEVEAIDTDGTIPLESLEEQCRDLLERFGVKRASLVAQSYSDMLLASYT